ILVGLMALGIVQRAAEGRAAKTSADATVTADSGERDGPDRPEGGDAAASDAGGDAGAEARGAVRKRRFAAVVYGSAGGFTSMVANAGGPVMSMYFLVMRLGARTFLGTAAWFFAATNLMKLPFSVGLGLITVPALLLNLVLLP